MKESLINRLLQVMAMSYHIYYRAHAFHWNIVGSNFQQYHDFFGDVYESVFSPIDDIAENVRKLGAFPSANLNETLQLVDVEKSDASDEETMLRNLLAINQDMIELLREAIKVADEEDEPAISNFLQERLDAHQKLNWKLTALVTYTV